MKVIQAIMFATDAVPFNKLQRNFCLECIGSLQFDKISFRFNLPEVEQIDVRYDSTEPCQNGFVSSSTIDK